MNTDHHMARMDKPAKRIREPRFEIVHNAGELQPWWGRFVAANGRIVWTTESYRRRGPVLRAIELVTGHAVRAYRDGLEVPSALGEFGLLEVREVEA